MRFTLSATLLAVTAIAVVAAAPHPVAAEPLGQPGQIAIAGDFQIAIQSISVEDVDDSVTAILVAPSGDFFIIPNLSVGGQVIYANRSFGDVSERTIGLGVRAGYVIGLGKVSIWPKAGFSYTHDKDDLSSTSALTLNLFAPLLVHPVDHIFLGLGPNLDLDLYAADDRLKATAIGITSTIGGYF